MSLYDAYESSHSTFEDIVFIAGTDYPMEFPVYDHRGIPMNITSFTAKWFLSPYGQPEITIAEIECLASGSGTFTVTIPRNLTLSLSGAHTHQVEVVDAQGKTTRVAQGTILIRKATPSIENLR